MSYKLIWYIDRMKANNRLRATRDADENEQSAKFQKFILKRATSQQDTKTLGESVGDDYLSALATLPSDPGGQIIQRTAPSYRNNKH